METLTINRVKIVKTKKDNEFHVPQAMTGKQFVSWKDANKDEIDEFLADEDDDESDKPE